MMKVLILGAAGRDFHNFNMFFRDNSTYFVVGFTANQIPIFPEENIQKNLVVNYIQKGFLFLMNLILKN